MAETPTSPRPRRVATPSWLDLRLVLGVALVLLAVVVGARVVSGASRTYGVLSAAHDLAAGAVVGRADVRTAQVQLPDHGRGVYLTDATDVVGKRLDRPLVKGELVPAAAVAHPVAQTTVTVPLADGAAPALHAGQRVELWFSSPACRSTILLRDVAVQSVRSDSAAFGSGGGQNVVISVQPASADRVVQALAISDVQVRAGVLAGPAAATGSSGATSGSDADVAACAAASPSR